VRTKTILKFVVVALAVLSAVAVFACSKESSDASGASLKGSKILDNAEYLFAKRPIALDSQAEKLLDEAGRKALGALLPRLESVENWTPAALDAAVRRYAEEAGLKLGKVAQPLRAALTGRTTSPGIFDVLEVLGREESLARIRDKVLRSKSA
jgi:glutamyl-tRNA synthetase